MNWRDDVTKENEKILRRQAMRHACVQRYTATQHSHETTMQLECRWYLKFGSVQRAACLECLCSVVTTVAPPSVISLTTPESHPSPQNDTRTIPQAQHTTEKPHRWRNTRSVPPSSIRLCHPQVLNTQLAPVVANLRNPESPLSVGLNLCTTTTDKSSRENQSAERNYLEQLWLDIQAPV